MTPYPANMKARLLKEISVRRLGKNETIPYGLLLDADPSIAAIEKYLTTSEIYVAVLKTQVIGVVVLHPFDKGSFEIKNIAVEESLQGNGIGKLLLRTVTEVAIEKGANYIIIGTSNSSIGQLYLYQRSGFEITEIRMNFFPDNYPEPIFENGIQCRHMIMLKKKLP